MFKVQKSENLKGEIQISGSKNAALPIVAANYLLGQKVNLQNVPKITDIETLKKVADEAIQKSKNYYDLTSILASKIRASILLIPVGLYHFGEVRFGNCGGCNIGKRPLTAFEDAFIQAGIEISQQENTKIYKRVKNPKKKIILSEFSVTTTEALLTYLSFLDLDYEIEVFNIAIEPHVINLIDFLKNVGAKIKLNYNHSLKIQPSKISVTKEDFSVIGDYIEAGTYFVLGALAGKEIFIKNFNPQDLYSVFKLSEKIGIDFEIMEDGVLVSNKNLSKYNAVKLQTMIYPGFPTDLQSIFGTLFTQCNGISKIFETLFEGRFSYLSELENLGANVEILNPHQAIIVGPKKLKGNYVSTKDLRGGGALLIAGILAEGETFIVNKEIILRGYSNILEKLRGVGVKIETL